MNIQKNLYRISLWVTIPKLIMGVVVYIGLFVFLLLIESIAGMLVWMAIPIISYIVAFWASWE